VMISLSWPAIIAMFLYGSNAVVSAAFVGQFVGETALAGVSVAYPLTQISVGFGLLIGVGAGAVLSIAIGSKDKSTQERLLGAANCLTLLVTAGYMAFGLAFSSELIKIMGGVGEVLILGESYFKITVIGALFWIYGLAANMIVRSEGKMQAAAVMMGIGLAVDVLANYVLVAKLNFGVEGSAWATNIAMLVYTLLGLVYFGKGFSSFKTRVLSFYWDVKMVKSIMSLGMSSFISAVMALAQGVVIFNALAQYGTVPETAFYGVVYRLFIFALTPIFGIMQALKPVVGINYGAGQYERVIHSYKLFTLASILLALPFWVISMTSPTLILGLMLPDQVFSGTQLLYFRIYMAIMPLLAATFMAMSFFPSINKGQPAVMIGLARQLVLYVPVMMILPKMMGVSGSYFGSLAIDAIIVLWTVVMVKKEFSLLRMQNKSAALGGS
ncbi:MAG: MATE family efflux transporter, partial [Sporomusa sp.]